MSSRLFYCFLAFYVASPLGAYNESPGPTAAVAIVNGQTITAAQLEQAVRPQLQAMEERVRQMRQAALDKLIDNLLLEQAARSQGISVDQYLQTRVESVTVAIRGRRPRLRRQPRQFLECCGGSEVPHSPDYGG